MSEAPFSDTDENRGDWVDVRMTDPDEGEWDVDVVVVEGRVEYVDLRVRPELLADFLECLIEDVGAERAGRILDNLADRADGEMA